LNDQWPEDIVEKQAQTAEQLREGAALIILL